MHSKNGRDSWFSGQGKFSDVPSQLWNSWQWQINHRLTSLDQLKQHLVLTLEEEEGCKASSSKLSFAITPHFFNLIDGDDPSCPIRRQVIPRIDETFWAPEEIDDPLGEEADMKVPGLVHRYPDRVLLLATNVCSSYCRYCTRSRLVSDANGKNFQPHVEACLEYIRTHQEVRDVLVSGGDPLLLPDRKIDSLLSSLRAIPHVEIIRIGSRAPVVMPQRITPELCFILSRHGPIWMSLHTNHPKECTLEMKKACEMLLQSKVILGNQSVLLRGVNNDARTLLSLSHRLMMLGVRPYYLYQCDLIKGSAHFRTAVDEGVNIIAQMRGFTSGYAIPQFVIDAPGGGGKIPVNPATTHGIEGDYLILENFKKERCLYPARPSLCVLEGVSS